MSSQLSQNIPHRAGVGGDGLGSTATLSVMVGEGSGIGCEGGLGFGDGAPIAQSSGGHPIAVAGGDDRGVTVGGPSMVAPSHHRLAIVLPS